MAAERDKREGGKKRLRVVLVEVGEELANRSRLGEKLKPEIVTLTSFN